MGLRELQGWVPSETHEHYDADGNPTGRTVVTREPRINDEERAHFLALLRWEDEICRDCGYHPSIGHDTSNIFVPESSVCPVAAGHAKWDRMLAEQDKKVPHDAPPGITRPSDGRTSYMRLAGEAEAAKIRAERVEST